MITKRDLSRLLWWLCVLLPLDTLIFRLRAVKNPRKILVIRLDALGDFVLWLDAARGLRNLYPHGEFEITLLANQNWADLAEALPEFEQVWSLDRRKFVTNLGYRWRLLQRVRREGFAVVVSPVFSRDFLWADTVVRASGASERWGYHGDPSVAGEFLMRLADRWYTRIIRSRPEPRSELERNADFLRGIGVGGFAAGVFALEPVELEPVETVCEPQNGYYILAPGAGKTYRQWPQEHFAEIAHRIYARTGLRGIITGGSGDRALGELLRQGEAPLENRTGETSLNALVALVADARLVVANETGIVHIAAAVGTPVVSITGGGHYGRFLPYHTERPVVQPLPMVVAHEMPCFGCNWQCIFPVPPDQPKPCIAAITPDAVWDAVMTILAARETLSPS